MEDKIDHIKKKELKIEEPKSPIKSNFDRSDLISILAVLLSLGALGVAILQANIMREQQEIMVTQQKASVLPYLIPYTKLNSTIKDGISYNEFTITITNKGFGPALLDSIKLSYNDVIYTDSYKLLLALSSELDSIGGITIGKFNDVFLSPGEEFTILNLLVDQKEDKNLNYAHIVKLKYTFCSILEECWIHENGKTTKAQNDK